MAMSIKSKQPILEWDTSELDTEDDDEVTMAWEDFKKNLTAEMNGKKYWRDDASNMGWLHRTGYKIFQADNGLDFIRAISPDTDCTYRIYRHYKYGFRIRLSHHDAPTGERHIIKPITEKQYEEANA